MQPHSSAVQTLTEPYNASTNEDISILYIWLGEVCFTSTETVGLLGTGAQDVHLDFHTAPGLCSSIQISIYLSIPLFITLLYRYNYIYLFMQSCTVLGVGWEGVIIFPKREPEQALYTPLNNKVNCNNQQIPVKLHENHVIHW